MRFSNGVNMYLKTSTLIPFQQVDEGQKSMLMTHYDTVDKLFESCSFLETVQTSQRSFFELMWMPDSLVDADDTHLQTVETSFHQPSVVINAMNGRMADVKQ